MPFEAEGYASSWQPGIAPCPRERPFFRRVGALLFCRVRHPLSGVPRPVTVLLMAPPPLCLFDLTDHERFADGFQHDAFARSREEAPVAWHVPAPLVRR